jgi:manganese efflux pump family protein
VKDWDRWIAFTLPTALGSQVVWVAARVPHTEIDKPSRYGFWLLALTGFATSIDAAAFAMAALALMVGHVLGAVTGRWAEAVGCVLLAGHRHRHLARASRRVEQSNGIVPHSPQSARHRQPG